MGQLRKVRIEAKPGWSDLGDRVDIYLDLACPKCDNTLGVSLNCIFNNPNEFYENYLSGTEAYMYRIRVTPSLGLICSGCRNAYEVLFHRDKLKYVDRPDNMDEVITLEPVGELDEI